MNDRRVPDFVIEQYVLGELPEDRAREVERTEGFAERVAAIKADNATFLEQYPPEVYARRIENQYGASRASSATTDARESRFPRRSVVRFVTFAVPGAAALLVLSLVLFGGIGVDTNPTADPDAEIVRLKGAEPQISVFRSTSDAGTPEQLHDGAIASPGDRLQITYNAGGHPYGAIVSVDGRGAVTLHYPLTERNDPELAVGGDQQLPYAYQLDNAPDFERFYFITSDETFDVAGLLDRIRGQADAIAARPDRDLNLSRNFDVATVTIRKGE